MSIEGDSVVPIWAQRECSVILVPCPFSSNPRYTRGLTVITQERNPSPYFIFKDAEAERESPLE